MGISIVEVVILGLLLALLFGSRRLPRLGAELGRGVRDLRATFSGRRRVVEDAPFDEPLAKKPFGGQGNKG